MKLLVISHTWPYPPYKDGSTLITYQLLKHLPKNHQVDLFYLDELQNEKKGNTNFKNLNYKFFKVKKRSLCRYYLTHLWPRSLPYGLYRYESASLRNAIELADQEKKYDCIIFSYPFLANYLTSIKHTPTFLNIVDDITNWFYSAIKSETNIRKKFHLAFEAYKHEAVEKKLYPLATSAAVVSQQDKESLMVKGFDKNKLFVIPNGVDTEYFKPMETKLEKSLIFTGNMGYQPNEEAILYFYKNIWPNLNGWKWYIVGKNPSAKIKALKENEGILITGEVEDIRPYLAKSLIYISPIKSGTGVKNKILEAMSSGKAIIATPESITNLPVFDSKELLVAKNENDFILKIEKLAVDDKERKRLEVSARNCAVEKFSWLKSISLYEKCFDKTAK